MKITTITIKNYKWLALTPMELSTCPTNYILVLVEESGERRIYIFPGNLM